HEQRRAGAAGVRADQVEALSLVGGARQLHVDERDVERERAHHLARVVEAADRGDHLGAARRLQQLDEVVARDPLVLDDQGAPPHRATSAGSSTIERVRSPARSSRNAALPSSPTARRRVTSARPIAPSRGAAGPGPLSSTTHVTVCAAVSAVRTAISPPSWRRSAPCFTAFSTSGCKSRRGSRTPRVSSANSPPKRMAPRGRTSIISADRGGPATPPATRGGAPPPGSEP